MKIKLNTILVANAIFRNIIDNDTDNKIDSTFKFKLLTMLKDMSNSVSAFEEIRNEKIKEYGAINEENGQYYIDEKSDNVKKFNEELLKLVDEEVDININKIKINDAIKYGLNSYTMQNLIEIIEP